MPSSFNVPSAFEGSDKSVELHQFEFTGTAAELWPIIFKNLIFNILTLSLYRFWARTNVRHYIWENTRFKGDPLQYTGEGGDLFKGFLVALVFIFLPLFGLIIWAQILMESGSMGLGISIILIAYGFMLWLLPLGIFKAHKYRLSRTRWRGIRGAVEGSGTDYAWASLGYFLLLAITGGLAFPFVENALWKKMINKTRFGDKAFRYDMPPGPLYRALFAYIGFGILGFIVFGIFTGLGSVSGSGFVKGLGFAVGYILMLFSFGFGYVYYLHRQLGHFWNNTRYQSCRFSFTGELGDMTKMYMVSFGLVIVTFGIAYPIMQMWFVRYVMANMKLVGDLDLAAIGQSKEEEPAFGEGLAEGFDMGSI
jgi:uncharacterized membrane protein YjgN (DUF898 family)